MTFSCKVLETLGDIILLLVTVETSCRVDTPLPLSWYVDTIVPLFLVLCLHFIFPPPSRCETVSFILTILVLKLKVDVSCRGHSSPHLQVPSLDKYCLILSMLGKRSEVGLKSNKENKLTLPMHVNTVRIQKIARSLECLETSKPHMFTYR